MKSILFIAILLSSTANAKVYKCIDETGKKTYSQTVCKTNGSMEKRDFTNTQPVMTEKERLMRLKNDIGMKKHYRKVKARKQALRNAREVKIRQVEQRQINSTKAKARRKKKRDYYKNKADFWNASKSKMDTKEGKRSAGNIADEYYRESRKYR